MSWFFYFILFFFVFRAIGSFVIKFLLNGNVNSARSTGNFSADFQRILNEMLNNLNQRSHYGGQQYRTNSGGGHSNAQSSGGAMSRKEAFDILGLAENASADEIKSAYRKLMMKMHPDSGGSKYLSQKINEAKSLLLGE